MPSLNLRLTDEQHERLRSDAVANRRSIQGEIIVRLFPDPSVPADDTQKTPAEHSSGQPGRRTRSGRAAAAGRSDEIRTDFK